MPARQFEYVIQFRPAHHIEGFGQVYENHIQQVWLLNAFFLELSQWKYHVRCTSRGAKASNLPDSGKEETGKSFPGNTQKRHATIVVAIPTIALVLAEINDVGVSGIVRKTSSIPAFREYAEKHRYQGFATIYQNLGEMPSCPGDFLFLRPLIVSFTSSMAKELSNSWRTGSCYKLDNA